MGDKNQTFEDEILDAIERCGYVVIKLNAGGKLLSQANAKKLAEALKDDQDSHETLIAELSFNALCAQVEKRSGEFTDVVSFVESLDLKDDELIGIAGDLIDGEAFDPKDPVIVWATVAATSENFMEVADALNRLREALRARSIYGRAQLDLMR